MARFRIRHVAFLAVCIVFVWHILPREDTIARLPLHHGAPHGTTEEVGKYMNDPNQIPSIVATASSFVWNTVKFTYPPELKPRLPAPFKNRPQIQTAKSPKGPAAAITEKRRLEVKKVFERNWASYKNHAWMKDALNPLSGEAVDQFSGWAATLVDSLDTLWMMGMRDEFYEAVKAVSTIDFGASSSGNVNMFETCIRYLGGLIAAYDLSGHEVLKQKAIEVGDLLYSGFNTENRMPVDFIQFEDAKKGGGLYVEYSVVSASPGTITLEFSRLSQITGDHKYYAAVSHVMDTFYEHQNETKLPGMWPMMVSMRRQDVTSGYQFTIAGNADSLYEYLPKAHALLGAEDASSAKYETMSRTFMDTAMKNLFFRPMIPGGEDILISGNCDVLDDGPRLDPESEHLSCFIGGLFALGGRLFQNDEYLTAGAKLARGCAYAYKSMPTGIMPERYNMVLCPDPKNCKWDDDVYLAETKKRKEYQSHLPKGFTTAKDPRYILRPEAIESIFILYRITGEEEWRDIAWDMFTSIVKVTETPFANAAIEDVTVEGGGKQIDYMESFWLAETLKYFYLVFADPDLISLDDFVLNTEAHPFRLAK